ncbi:MAG: diacylglycerol kinase family protein [Chloroflexi bacterium]|nr:diacylglycerol kinase family protein [Chloroflexota bacterium]
MRQPVLHETPNPSRASFRGSFRFAFQGVAYVVRTQRNFRIHMAVASLAILAAIALRVPAAEVAIIVVCAMVVFAAEMFNTVVEAIVDLVTNSYHPLAKIAKDVAAGAVLVSAAGSVLVGILVLGPYLWHALVR